MIKAILIDCFGVLYTQNGTRYSRNDDIFGLIKRLKPKYSVVLFSNMGESTMNKLFTQPERSKLFDLVLISGQTGLTKPHPAAFKRALETLDIIANETLLIDDSMDNCRAADSLGLESIWYKGAQSNDEIAALLH